MAEDPKHLDEGRVRRLEYRDGAADREPVDKGQVIGGVIFSMLLVIGGVFLGMMASLQHGSVPFFIVVGLTVLLCNGWAYIAYQDPAHRSLGMGLWIGFGAAVLIEGACFGLTMRS